MTPQTPVEWYRKYRPTMFKEIVGQKSAVAIIRGWFRANQVSHTILLSGPSGCGKTTAARIIANKLGCVGSDFHEINFADARGIETVREMRQLMPLSPMSGPCRVFLCDEFHRATADAASSMLKMLEECPAHVYFLLATTEPHRIIQTIMTRSAHVKFVPVNESILAVLVRDIAKREGVSVSDELVDAIVESAEGSPRKALVVLQQVAVLPTDAERIEAIVKNDVRMQAISLARAIIGKKPWKEIAVILKGLEKEDAEGLRRLVLSYSRSVLLNGSPQATQADFAITMFEKNFYDSGHAGLASACYAVCNRK